MPVRTLSPIAVFLLVALAALPARAQSSDHPSRFARWAYQDGIGLARQIASPETPAMLVGVAAVLMPVSLLDKTVDYKIKPSDDAFGTYLDWTNELGGPRMTLPVVGVFAASLLTDDTRLQDAAFTSLESLLYAGALSYGLKYTFGRSRPYEEAGPFQFSPFSGRSSFPSGHTVTAFAVLTPWVLYYPHPATYTLYALGTGTAVARIARDKHWATDVLAGGTLGFLTAYWLTQRHQGSHAPDLQITPVLGYEKISLSLRLRF